MPPGPTRLGKKLTPHENVRQTEQGIADQLGGVRQPGSGSGLIKKADVELTDFLLDSKQTESSGIVITGEMLTKISREALERGKHPGIIVTVAKHATITSGQWALIPMDVFAALVENSDAKQG